MQVVNGQTLEKDDETKRQHFDFEDDFNAGDDESVTFDDFETMSYTSSEKIEEERRKEEEVRRAEEEQRRKEEVRRAEEEQRKYAVGALIAIVIKADGHVANKELKLTRGYLKKYVNDREYKYTWMRLNGCLKSKNDRELFEYSCKAVNDNMGYYEKLALTEMLIDIARLGNIIRPSEWKVLNDVMERFGIEKRDISYFSRKYLAVLDGGTDNGGEIVLSPYSILGIGTDATAEEIQSAHLELMDKYNPDAVSDSSMKQVLIEKSTEIVSAYETLMSDKNQQ